MRNLKRALSLAMASIMVIGLMVTGAGAVSFNDFTDKDKIVNQEAVSTLVELGVIAGRDATSFDPTGIVTRAEMAKMICVVLNGGRDPQPGSAVKNTYTDTVGHWAAGYIEYCSNLKIVAGYGDGTFKPNATVTATEAAKMLLVAAGYQSAIEGFTGSMWATATDVRANQIGLYDDLVVNPGAGLTRDAAAQMVFNALSATKVSYEYTLVANGNGGFDSVTELKKSDKTLLEDHFGAIKVEGVVIANEYATLSSSKTNTDNAASGVVIGASMDEGKTMIRITNTDDQKKFSGNETFSVGTGVEELGRAVTLFVKPSSTAQKSTVFGAAILSDENKVVTDYSSDSIADVADNNNLDLVKGTTYAYNYGNSSTDLEAAEKAVKTGVEKIMIDADDDGEVDYVLLNTVQLGKVTATSTKDKGSITVTVASSKTYKMDNSKNVIGFDDVAKDDMVLTSFIGGRLYVEVAETVTGTIEAYKLNGKGEYTTALTVDGTVYTVSRVPTIVDTDLTASQDMADKTILDSDATFYLDKQGYIIAQGDVKETAYNYALVWGGEAGGVVNDTRVKVTLSDGTTGTYKLNSDSSLKKADLATSVGTVYAYTLNSKGDTIKLMNPTGGTVEADSPVFEKGKSTIKVSNATPSTTTTFYANNSTVFFYVTMDGPAVDKVTVHVGRNAAPTLSDGTDATNKTYLALGRTDVGAVAFQGVSSKESAGDHMFIYSAGRVYNDYTEAKAFLKGSTESADIKVSSYDTRALNKNGDLKDGLYLYTIDSDGYYELTTPTMASKDFYVAGMVTRTFGSTIVLNQADENNAGTNEFVITKDTIVIDNTDNPSTPNAIANGSISTDDVVTLLENSDNEIFMIVIDNTEDKTTDPEIPAGAFKGDSTIAVSGNTITYTYHASKFSNMDFRTALAAQMGIDAARITNVNLTAGSVSIDGDAYQITAVEMIAVKYNGTVKTYVEASNAPSKALVITGTGTVVKESDVTSAGITAVSGEITIPAAAMNSATDVNFVTSYKLTGTNVEADGKAVTSGHYVIPGATITMGSAATGTYARVGAAAPYTYMATADGTMKMPAAALAITEGYVKVILADPFLVQSSGSNLTDMAATVELDKEYITTGETALVTIKFTAGSVAANTNKVTLDATNGTVTAGTYTAGFATATGTYTNGVFTFSNSTAATLNGATMTFKVAPTALTADVTAIDLTGEDS